mmetsp:Transcript_1630/g.4591  ORF Transcript_1630/g.4591 Transcript_1630/m.4591 type:complete len:226 (+) Transcript_1630:1117-1794(+)
MLLRLRPVVRAASGPNRTEAGQARALRTRPAPPTAAALPAGEAHRTSLQARPWGNWRVEVEAAGCAAAAAGERAAVGARVSPAGRAEAPVRARALHPLAGARTAGTRSEGAAVAAISWATTNAHHRAVAASSPGERAWRGGRGACGRARHRALLLHLLHLLVVLVLDGGGLLWLLLLLLEHLLPLLQAHGVAELLGLLEQLLLDEELLLLLGLLLPVHHHHGGRV